MKAKKIIIVTVALALLAGVSAYFVLSHRNLPSLQIGNVYANGNILDVVCCDDEFKAFEEDNLTKAQKTVLFSAVTIVRAMEMTSDENGTVTVAITVPKIDETIFEGCEAKNLNEFYDKCVNELKKLVNNPAAEKEKSFITTEMKKDNGAWLIVPSDEWFLASTNSVEAKILWAWEKNNI